MTNDRPTFFDEGLVTEFDSVEQNFDPWSTNGMGSYQSALCPSRSLPTIVL